MACLFIYFMFLFNLLSLQTDFKYYAKGKGESANIMNMNENLERRYVLSGDSAATKLSLIILLQRSTT